MYSQSCKTKSAFQHNVMLINECTCTFNTASHTSLSSIAPPPHPTANDNGHSKKGCLLTPIKCN